MLQNSGTTRLDPRVKRTRQMLQTAFNELMRETDLQNISVQDIATRAGVNRATFYAHFEDKYALLNYSIREMLQGQLEQKLSDMHSFSVPNLRGLIVVVSEFLAQFYGHCAPVAGGSNQHMLMAAQVQVHLYELFLQWIRPLNPGMAEQAATALSWTIFGTALQSARGTRRIPADQIAEQVLAFLKPSLNQIVGETVGR